MTSLLCAVGLRAESICHVKQGPFTLASQFLRDKGTATHFWSRKAAVEAEIRKAEQDGIAAGVLPSKDGKTATDPGFPVARAGVKELYAMSQFEPPARISLSIHRPSAPMLQVSIERSGKYGLRDESASESTNTLVRC